MRNEADILERCLSAMEELDYPKEFFEVVLVNDGSTDNTGELITGQDWSFTISILKLMVLGCQRPVILVSEELRVIS